jgi:hypothetical protein
LLVRGGVLHELLLLLRRRALLLELSRRWSLLKLLRRWSLLLEARRTLLLSESRMRQEARLLALRVLQQAGRRALLMLHDGIGMGMRDANCKRR